MRVSPDSEMDITTVFGTVVPGSNPGRGTDEQSENEPRSTSGRCAPGFEDHVSILWSEANRNPHGVRRDFKRAKRLLKSKCSFEESYLKL